MPLLNIVDEEIINSDPLRELLLFGDLINQSSNVIESDIAFSDEGVVSTRTSRVEVQVSPSVTQERILELVESLEGLSILSHRTKIYTSDADGDQGTFNYNNYTSDAFSYYNLRNDDYEIFSEINDEKSLPNFCLGALWSRQEVTSEQLNYYTMFNAIPGLQDSQILAGATPINNYEFDDEYLVYDNVDPELETKKDYFKLLLRSGSINTNEYIEANTHVFVDFNYNLNDSSQIGNTPFFNRIKLPSQVNLFNAGPETPSLFREASMTNELLKSFRSSNSFLREFSINGTTTSLKVYDLIEMFESISYSTTLTRNDEMFLRSENQNYAIDDNSPFTFYFYKLLLLGKLRTKIKGKTKGFSELIAQSTDHETEHLGFKVIKRISGRVTPIQTFYFLNRAGLKDFIDTQVKFDRLYTYEVIGMFAVFGSNYSYQDVQIISDPSPSLNEVTRGINFTFTNRPSVKIVEVPMATHELRIIEPPPIVPEISFYNEMTTKNKLKIRMEHQDGNIVDEYLKKPLRPFSGNEQYISKLKEYFGGSDDILVTSGKTSDGIYEIYRLDEPPTSYLDFEDSLIATVQSNVVYSNGEQSRNAMFTDLIKHQQKYYYTFRTLTHRGNPSELSPIYVVEMYEDADETFLTFDLYQMPESNSYQVNSHMRKYIQIIPNQEHISVNEEQLLQLPTAQDALTALTLGNPDLEERLFSYDNENKYIKLRLESKNSGRKMDINLFFKRKITNN